MTPRHLIWLSTLRRYWWHVWGWLPGQTRPPAAYIAQKRRLLVLFATGNRDA